MDANIKQVFLKLIHQLWHAGKMLHIFDEGYCDNICMAV